MMNKASFFSQSGTGPEPHRVPIQVTHILRFPSGLAFPVCPACGVTLEREYQHYCDRCGQCLSWKYFSRATVVLWSGCDNRLAVHGLGQSVTLSGENDNVGVMDKPVDQCGSEAVVTKDCVPLGEFQIGSDDQALALITV